MRIKTFIARGLTKYVSITHEDGIRMVWIYGELALKNLQPLLLSYLINLISTSKGNPLPSIAWIGKQKTFSEKRETITFPVATFQTDDEFSWISKRTLQNSQHFNNLSYFLVVSLSPLFLFVLVYNKICINSLYGAT